MADLRSRFLATTLGAAVGDAMAAGVEFCSLAEIRRRYGPEGVTDLPPEPLFTDDTQNLIAVAEAVLDSGVSPDPETVLPFLARRLVEWFRSPENNRAPGTTCMAGCRALAQGVHWRHSGVAGSMGCGAAMRVAPIGLLYSDRTALREIARASAQITHGHPAAAAAAHAAALAVRLVIDDCPVDDLLQELAVTTAGDSAEWATALEKIPLALAATRRGEVSPDQVQMKGPERWRLGEGWVADEAVACALYCYLLAIERGEGYRQAVIYAANTQGDSDTLACLAGGLAGAAWGLGGDRGLPLDWAARVEKSAYLHDLGDRLYRAVIR